jgi:hypothetical protein
MDAVGGWRSFTFEFESAPEGGGASLSHHFQRGRSQIPGGKDAGGTVTTRV